MPVPRAWSRRAAVGSWAVLASLVLVAAAAPFERPLPGAPFGFTLTTVEAFVLLALASAAWTMARSPIVPSAAAWRVPLAGPALACLLCALVAALAAAPELRAGSIKVVARLTVAFLLFAIVVHAARSMRVAERISATLLGSGAIVGAIAVLELAQVPAVLDALTHFRPGFHVVGGQLRATATLVYPTITSMFLEVAFALGLMWIGRGRWGFAALVAVGAGVIATFTRAGLITMALSLVVYGALTWRASRRWTVEHTRLVLLAAVLAALVLASRSPQMLVARLSTDVSQDWYGASYTVPSTLTLRPDSFNDIPVTVANRGRITWQSTITPPFALSYHWLDAATEEVVIYDGLRTPFVRPVAPGESIAMRARVRAPGYPGDYILVWDVVQEHRTWLSLEGVYPGRTIASVEGEAVTPPLASMGRMPAGVMRMPRPVLWGTALELAAERPVLGIGPDNFRHVYGHHLGLASWDTRVHANNTYLEVLVGMGVVGLVAFAWLLVAAARLARTRLAAVSVDHLPLAAAAAAACLAIAVHGLVDSFLTFTTTYVVFALAAGVLFRHADRV